MRRHFLWFQSVTLLLVVFSSVVLAGGHGEAKPEKTGILLVAFGSSIPSAQAAFDNIDQKVAEAFPGVPVRWAYTSSIIRKKLAKQGKQLDSVEMALSKMMEENFTHVAVQSLHTIAGAEYHDLLMTTNGFRQMADGFQSILVGYPLLGTQEDLDKVVAAMMKQIPQTRKKDEAVLLMGHGTHHPINCVYAAMAYNFQRKDPNIFVGTVEGAPLIDEIKTELMAKKIKKAYLMPFMSVAGDHAVNDMAGDEEDSWKSILTAAGIQSVPILKGTAEFDEIVDVWVDHLRIVMAHFKE
jgi:sirohydrochlorin cobaltochelatase